MLTNLRLFKIQDIKAFNCPTYNLLSERLFHTLHNALHIGRLTSNPVIIRVSGYGKSRTSVCPPRHHWHLGPDSFWLWEAILCHQRFSSIPGPGQWPAKMFPDTDKCPLEGAELSPIENNSKHIGSPFPPRTKLNSDIGQKQGSHFQTPQISASELNLRADNNLPTTKCTLRTTNNNSRDNHYYTYHH